MFRGLGPRIRAQVLEARGPDHTLPGEACPATLLVGVIAHKVSTALHVSPDLDYRTARRTFSESRARLLLWCIATIYPAFGLLDWLVYPTWTSSFVTFRALICGSALVLLFISRRQTPAAFP